MGIFANDLIELIIRPALIGLNLNSLAAEQLLAGTCAQESHMGLYLRQQKGPALGIFQIEPATHMDIYENFLKFRPDLINTIYSLCAIPEYKDNIKPPDECLIYNLKYSACIARIKYLRAKDALPGINDTKGQSDYWKRIYNSQSGSGDTASYLINYEKFVKPYYTK